MGRGGFVAAKFVQIPPTASAPSTASDEATSLPKSSVKTVSVPSMDPRGDPQRHAAASRRTYRVASASLNFFTQVVASIMALLTRKLMTICGKYFGATSWTS